MGEGPYLVLVTGPPGAGKSTLAPRIAECLGAVCISRDAIHDMVFDAWEPEHPLLIEDGREGPTLNEGKLNWDIFLWTLFQVSRRAPVVGETPLNHEINRARLLQLRNTVEVPFVEVFLNGDPNVLMQRVLKRAGDPGSHPIKVHFTVDGARELLARPYAPLLPGGESIEVDTTDLDAIDAGSVADQLKQLLSKLGLIRDARDPQRRWDTGRDGG